MSAALESNNPAEGGFQHYTIIREHLAAEIPDWMTYEQACVMPLMLSTATYGLFHPDYLGLDLPTVPAPAVTATSEAVIITGGASSVGSNAVQLAVSAGYLVYSTASLKNFDYVKRLGAAHVFDYHSPTLVDDIVKVLGGQQLAGAYCIGSRAVEACNKVLRRCNAKKRFIVFAGFPIPADQIATYAGRASFIGSAVGWLGKTTVTSFFTGTPARFVEGKDMCQPNAVIGMIYGNFLPRALAAHQFVPAPEPLVVGKGLEKIQEAMEIQAKGVSAQKVVVSL
jgi:NADPH:quinone reductase-like Zn-dependent oxidoreductase